VSAPEDRLLSDWEADQVHAKAVAALTTWPHTDPLVQYLGLALLAFTRDRTARQELAYCKRKGSILSPSLWQGFPP